MAVVVPPPPIVEVVKTDSIETISNPDKLDQTPDVIKQVEERPKKPPLTGVNLLSIEDADSITNNKENEQNKDAKRDPISTVNEDETSTGDNFVIMIIFCNQTALYHRTLKPCLVFP